MLLFVFWGSTIEYSGQVFECGIHSYVKILDILRLCRAFNEFCLFIEVLAFNRMLNRAMNTHKDAALFQLL